MKHPIAQAEPDAPELAVREPTEHDGSIRETLESVVVAFVLAFVFRAFVVEAFVIPTGSMAPTLLGQHVTLTCPQCGYRFAVGPRDHVNGNTQVARPLQGIWRDRAGNRSDNPLEVDCPMCTLTIEHRALRTDAGDRILVLKYIYALTEPRRWDVVVFKNPQDPDEHYIKRLVGLPGEQLWIVNGNVYTRPIGESGAPDDAAPWQIQRKTVRPEVQDVVWQPVYHSDYYPLDGGEPGPGTPRTQTWRVPWQPAGDAAAGWTLERGARWRWAPPEGGAAADQQGTLSFDFSASPHYRYNYYAYNLLEDRGYDGYDDRNLISETRVAVTAMPEEPGLSLALLSTSRELYIRGRIDAEGNAVVETAEAPPVLSEADTTLREAARAGGPPPPPDQPLRWVPRGSGKIAPLPPRRGTRVELWHVDQSISLWVDGRQIASWEYDLNNIGRELGGGGPAEHEDQPPVVEVQVGGSPVVLRSIDLDRDLYYTDGEGYDSPGRGTFGGPTTIAHDQFFCLGDNSPRSGDGRRWTGVDAWVDRVRDVPPGFVSREMMLGRAFFVYYPASHQIPLSPIGVPNFGDMRFIR